MEKLLYRPDRPRRISLVGQVRAALALRRERRRLGHLSDHLLADIGISRAEANREAERPIWDVPANWRRG